jgi:hypothetical protein
MTDIGDNDKANNSDIYFEESLQVFKLSDRKLDDLGTPHGRSGSSESHIAHSWRMFKGSSIELVF